MGCLMSVAFLEMISYGSDHRRPIVDNNVMPPTIRDSTRTIPEAIKNMVDSLALIANADSLKQLDTSIQSIYLRCRVIEKSLKVGDVMKATSLLEVWPDSSLQKHEISIHFLMARSNYLNVQIPLIWKFFDPSPKLSFEF